MTLKDLQDLINQEISKKDKVKTVRKFAVGIGIAAAGGLVAGILIAQKSGKETREDLKKKTGNTIESVRDRVKKRRRRCMVPQLMLRREHAMLPRTFMHKRRA
jgi:hypothetical protein